MTKVLVTESNLEGIATAIRTKKGVQTTYKPGQMAAAIESIETPNLEALTATQNGTYTPSSGKNGFSGATVNVPNSYSQNDEGKVVSNGALVAQTAHAEVTQNGTIDTTLNNSVVVNVSGGGGGTPLQFHLGCLKIDTGVITESDEYCYSDLIPISNSTGRWFLDLARSGMDSYYVGLCFFAQDGVTAMGYVRQYEAYRSYNNSSGNGSKFVRIANKVSNLSFASAVFCVDNIHIINSASTAYQAESM